MIAVPVLEKSELPPWLYARIRYQHSGCDLNLQFTARLSVLTQFQRVWYTPILLYLLYDLRGIIINHSASPTVKRSQLLALCAFLALILAYFVFVFGGNLGGNFYSVNDETAGVLEGPDNASLAVISGKFASLSHLDFFIERTATVPDGGTTLMMLGGALAGLGGLRRYLKNGAI